MEQATSRIFAWWYGTRLCWVSRLQATIRWIFCLGLKSCSLEGIILHGLLMSFVYFFPVPEILYFPTKVSVLGPWGKRSTDNTTAVNLFYIMLSLNIHLWACGVVASYVPQLSYCDNCPSWDLESCDASGVEALELRIAGKAVWFEPIEDDEDEEEQLNTDSLFFHQFCRCLVTATRRQQLEGEGPSKAMRQLQIYLKAMDPPVRQLVLHLKVPQDHSGCDLKQVEKEKDCHLGPWEVITGSTPARHCIILASSFAKGFLERWLLSDRWSSHTDTTSHPQHEWAVVVTDFSIVGSTTEQWHDICWLCMRFVIVRNFWYGSGQVQAGWNCCTQDHVSGLPLVKSAFPKALFLITMIAALFQRP